MCAANYKTYFITCARDERTDGNANCREYFHPSLDTLPTDGLAVLNKYKLRANAKTFFAAFVVLVASHNSFATIFWHVHPICVGHQQTKNSRMK